MALSSAILSVYTDALSEDLIAAATR
jgi:hypothetical protein